MSSGFHLTRWARLQVEAAREVFAPWGLTSELQQDGGHMYLKVTGPRGGSWRLVIAGTPRDGDHAVQHARQNAKKLLREINVRAGY